MGKKSFENRLAKATSPYLLQHAHNPVDWYPWGDEALGRAQQENKPILLSIGYSACHWCHVMEHESFANEDIANDMNAHFVCIKVDREERPDLDDIYMQATLAMNNGQGGWPMTVFLTPDKEPFFAGTYFPPDDRYGRPGFRRLLTELASLWENDPQSIHQQAALLTQQLKAQAQSSPPRVLGPKEITAAVQALEREFDPDDGGFGGAPKFPPHHALLFLLRHHARTGDARSKEMVTTTLDAMAFGGIRDHLAGGFARYSVDARWLVPHFEKMLYDNAQLIRAYLQAYQLTHKSLYREVAAETLDFVLESMTGPEGGFYSAYDADSEGEEGKYYVWSKEQVEDLLDEQIAPVFCDYFDITDHGNWEGTNILNTPESVEVVARRHRMSEDALRRVIDEGRQALLESRRHRVPPGLDDKVITSWNGLMLGALAEGFWVLGDARYLEAATNAAEFALSTLRIAEGRLLRTYRAGTAHIDAYLEDYAFLSEGLLDLYEAAGGAKYLQAAQELVAMALQDFGSDVQGGLFNTAAHHRDVLYRHRDGHDGATPNANAVMASVLHRLGTHLDKPDWKSIALAALEAHGKSIARIPRAYLRSLMAVDSMLTPPLELVLAVPTNGDWRAAESLRRALSPFFLPHRVIAHRNDKQTKKESSGLLAGKTSINGRAALYICKDYTCQAPLTDESKIRSAVQTAIRQQHEERRSSVRPRLAGRATPEGTSHLKARHTAVRYRPLGDTGLWVSSLGFGTYRVHEEIAQHREALLKALQAGVNLIDTSTNYTGGSSEILVGGTLQEALANHIISRDQVVIVSKLGYLQGDTLEAAKKRSGAGKPYPDIVEYSENLWHCIHPEFLDDQLNESLERLQLESLDVLLLHNPEYFLATRWRDSKDIVAHRQEFYQRLQSAFEFLERQVQVGRIGMYGVSSNTLAEADDHPESTALEPMLEAAKRAAAACGSEKHHLRVIQAPLNLLEPEAALPHGHSLLSRAARANIAFLANRPFNAIKEGRLIRLAEASTKLPPNLPELSEALQSLAAGEAELVERLGDRLTIPAGDLLLSEYLRWGEELHRVAQRKRSLPEWVELEQAGIRPRVQRVFGFLNQFLRGTQQDIWRKHRKVYAQTLETALLCMRRRAAESSREEHDSLNNALAGIGAPAGANLSQKALWVLQALPITTVLCGMRQPSYVDEAIATLSWPACKDPFTLLRRLQSNIEEL